MPIPDQPYTRDEMYLNAIATGDSSGVPATPYTRKEMYLEAIAKGGGGSSGGGVLVVNIDEEYSALDKTWQEIHDAIAQGTPCVTLYTEDDDVMQGRISSATIGGPPGSEIYRILALVTQGLDAVVEKWQASSADGYPAYMSE